MNIVKSPVWLHWLLPHLTWHHSRHEKIIYLTFDDGPIPDVTPQVLNILKKYNIQASFFCVGENIVKYPEIFEQLRIDGHRIGNHTFNHLKGWGTSLKKYLENVEKCHQYTQSNLFRPPYGKCTPQQFRKLRKQYKIIMWDVITYDFDTQLSPQDCYNNAIQFTTNGSIVVFHDNVKALPRLLYALPKAIEYWLAAGYEFRTL
ncbi:polysaccharide deacetylase family protein [Olivibacter domesticus]|uniref:Peptidoglycan/xylan/chitin deacetylase, PgdA/CDA1 family n=1 Tax=Olivibacter domesticus TaxID=407022 RepID=A0A1H7MAA0_OLID1|nr:polysaccharide deacetylase family protein [Olivibacter domesticus]SEL08260.1 Peptidoglycan/xylan/chitin deacetylase, PgdA/CDA1 family [Olivibacter domesticus]